MRPICVVALVAVIPLVSKFPDHNGFDIRSHYTKHESRIPMRDGVRLFTAVYVPKGESRTYPILMNRTPYSIAPYGPDAYPKNLEPSNEFAEDQFIFVNQDVRGRFMSEGEWVEMRPEKDATQGSQDVDESTDTYDTIEWLLKNVPQNNGKVGLFGVSYPGFYTAAGMINAHPALVAASPQAPVADLYMGDDAYHNGTFLLMGNFSFYTSFTKQQNPTADNDDKRFDYGTKDGYHFYFAMGALINSETKYFHYRNPYWTDVIKHTTYDEFWKPRNILPHLKNIKPAVLIVGGWFDAEDLSGTLKSFRAIEQQSPATAVKLVMGPWEHGGWAEGNGDKLGNLSFNAKTSKFFRHEIELPFFRHYLKGTPDPDLPKAYVFETGKDVWQKKSEWPPNEATPRRLYFHVHGELAPEVPSESDAFDEYISDPDAPVPAFSKPTLYPKPEYMDADQRFTATRRDVLTYETNPLKQDFTIAGPVSPSLFVSTTGTDSDFVVKLVDGYPPGGPLSGYEQLVRGEPFRAKFRYSFESPEPVEPGKVEQIRFAMPDVYHCFLKGHRIIVQIQSSWFPILDRNPQTFTDIPTAKPKDFVKAMQRIYRSSSAASFIQVNVEQ